MINFLLTWKGFMSRKHSTKKWCSLYVLVGWTSRFGVWIWFSPFFFPPLSKLIDRRMKFSHQLPLFIHSSSASSMPDFWTVTFHSILQVLYMGSQLIFLMINHEHVIRSISDVLAGLGLIFLHANTSQMQLHEVWYKNFDLVHRIRSC